MKTNKLLAMLLTAAMALTLLAGCGSSASGAASGGAGSDDQTVFTMAIASMYTMNVGAADSGTEIQVFPLLYDQWIHQEADGSYTPRLITEWETSEDGLECALTLREGVKFHNGEDWNTEAVKVTLEWFASDTTLSLNPTWAKIESVEVVDDLHCVVNFREPDVTFINNVANLLSGYVAPKAFAELGADKYFEHPYGCGMYSFVSWDPNTSMTLERDPNYTYWDKAATTNIDRYEIKVISEDLTRVSALQTGEVNLITNIPYEQIDVLKNTDNIHVEEKEGTSVWWLGVECGTDHVFNDPNLRLAMSESIDREMIATSIYGNAIPCDWYIPSFNNAYDPQYSGQYYQYNPEHAKLLVAASNYDGTPIRMLAVNSFPKITELSQALTSMMEAAGFKVDLQMIEHSALNDTRKSGNYDLFISSFAYGTDATQGLMIQIVNDRGHFELNNEEINALIIEANVTPDDAARAKLLQKITKMCADITAPQVPLFSQNSSLAITNNATGYVFYANTALDLRNLVVA